MAELDTAERVGSLYKLGTRDELQFLAQLLFNLTLFHLCGTTHLFGLSLSREAFLIGTVDGIAHIEIVFGNQQSLLRQERKERHLIACSHQLRYDLHMGTLILRQLILYLKGADGVDIVAKEVDAVRIFATVGIDIEDGATHGKLAWLIDVIHLSEAKVTKRLLDV